MRARDEVPEHGLGDLEVGDDAVPQRPDRLDVAGRAPEHLLGFAADGEDLVAAAGVALDGDDGGLAGHDALALHVDERVGRPEVDREIVREQAVEPVEDHYVRLLDEEVVFTREAFFSRGRATPPEEAGS